ncbi:helix-turn-helix domain-containing protein [Corallococcus sp. BB11-1]|uniref:helix-turn-helix domain-containing protein n=1 Tax=Corallococcus sp. BB11-1 TaxID=2996783 RepID=UPI0010E9DD7C|nr:helix-turn-helix domain-containing protein [Corallococcus sp. BB11-1]MCY1029909.1 helix-turn-helix domain-containing protein [Corallococcus sp. BB11-1]RYZ38367.1 MAG: helix-turn-helix domain-containing protein [Myxococcaceae bacterium]
MTSPTADALPPRASEPVAASGVSLEQVRKLAQLITRELGEKGSGHPLFSLLGPNHESVPLPTDVLTLMQQLLAILASGDAVTVVPVHKELTTQQAANLLNVSRQYLVQLLDEGRIPFHRTGTHRRVYSKDVLEYRARQKSDRRAQLDAMMRESQDAGGYPELE